MASVDQHERPRDGDATAPMARRSASVFRGEKVGRYVVLHVLGEGGMGIVYAAYDPQLDRRVALKVVNADHRSERGRSIARRRLAREAQALAKLSHRNVVTVYDVGSHGDDLFVAMELVDGETLAEWLLVPRAWPEVVEQLLAAGRGLAAAHDVGVVHRDFKPSNVLVSPRGDVRVTDFGLARLETTTEIVSVADLEDSARSDELTRTGKVVGTPAYMAPEQHAGAPPDARADQYAFGMTLYEALFGTRPFGVLAGEALAAAKQLGVRRIPERDVTSRRVPRSIRRALARSLAPDPKHRFASMAQLLAALARAAHQRRRWAPLAGAVAVVVFAVGLPRVHADDDGDRCRDADAKVDAVWSDAARGRVRQALGAASSPARAASVRAAIDGLDRYADAWAGLHREACEATWYRGEQSTSTLDQRMACLDRRLDALRSTVDLLGEGDASLLPKSVDMMLALPSVHACASAQVVDPTPADGSSPAEARTLRQRIDRVSARAAAAQYEDARAEAEAVVHAARELDSEALLAEALLALAQVHDDLGDAAQATAALRDAAVAARRSGHARAEFDALVQLGHVAGVRRYDPSRAAFYLDQADSVLAAWGDAPELEARLASTRGRVAFVEGRDDDARVELELALELLRSTPVDEVTIASVKSQLAGVLLRRGDARGAEAVLEETLAVYERVFGPHHPRVAATLGNLGIVQADDARFEVAIEGMTRARQILDETFGADHPAVAMADDSLADVLRRAGRCDEAIDRFARAIAAYERVGVDGPQLGAPLLGLGRCELEQGRASAAVPVLQRAWDAVQGDGVSPVQRGDTALALGRALQATSESSPSLLDEAAALFEGALDPADDRWDELSDWPSAMTGGHRAPTALRVGLRHAKSTTGRRSSARLEHP